MRYVPFLTLGLLALGLLAGGMLLSRQFTEAGHQATTEAFMGVDMCPRDQVDSALALAVNCPDNNAFSAANGTMTLRTIEPCLALPSWPQDSGEGGDVPVEIQLYVQNVSDLVGAQVRINMDETNQIQFVTGSDTGGPFAGQGFFNSLRDAFDGNIRGLTTVSGGDPGSRLLFVGYLGTRGAGVSPDTPDAAPSVGAAAAAPGYPGPGFESVGPAGTAAGAGGIWLSFKVTRVPTFTSGIANIDLSASPIPASKVISHTAFQEFPTDIVLPESQLFDGAIALGGASCPALSTPPAPSLAADTDLPEATLTTLSTPINCTPEEPINGTAAARAQLWSCAVTNDSGAPAPGLALEFERTIPDASPQPAPLNQVHIQTPDGSWEVVDWYVNQPSHCDESLPNDSQLRLSFNTAVAPGGTATFKVETCFAVHTATLRIKAIGFVTVAGATATNTPTLPPGVTPTATPTPTATATPTPTAPPTPTATPTPTPTPTPSPLPPGFHDARAVRIGAPHTINLSRDGADAGRVTVTVANEGDHLEIIGVYLDVIPPFEGGCLPSGRLRQTQVILEPGSRSTLIIDGYPGDPIPGDNNVTFRCENPILANGLNYTWILVADAHGDDLAYSCSAGKLLTLDCGNNLAHDDEDPSDNRLSRASPRVRLP